MQTRKLKSKWQLLGGYKGGDETSKVEKIQTKDDEKESEESSSDEEETSSNNEEVSSSDKEASRRSSESLDYGSEDSDLSNRLDEELDRIETLEMELSFPAQGWNGCEDEIHALGSNHEEDGDQKLAGAEGESRVLRCDQDVDFGAVGDNLVETSSSEDPSSRRFADGPRAKEVEGGDQDEPEQMGTFAASNDLEDGPANQVQDGDDEEAEVDVDEEGEEAVSGARFLQQIDRDYICSPRLIVRGVYVGEVLKLVVKRKTEGTYVDWTMFNTNMNEQVLNIKGEMTYPFALSREAQGTKYGIEVEGGWSWRGCGYGFINLFPSQERPDPAKILHVDIHEAIFFGEDIPHHYHVAGRDCMKVSGAADVNCRQEGCGLRIWSNMFTTYETADEKVEYYQPRRKRKERVVENIFLSMVAFFNGEYKIVLHRDKRLKKYHEEVAWLTKDENAKYNDSVAAVDRLKVDEARLIWETNMPKSRTEGATLAEVSKLNLSFNDDDMKSTCRS